MSLFLRINGNPSQPTGTVTISNIVYPDSYNLPRNYETVPNTNLLSQDPFQDSKLWHMPSLEVDTTVIYWHMSCLYFIACELPRKVDSDANSLLHTSKVLRYRCCCIISTFLKAKLSN